MKNITRCPLIQMVLPTVLCFSMAPSHAQEVLRIAVPLPIVNGKMEPLTSSSNNMDNIRHANALLKYAKPQQPFIVIDDMFISVSSLLSYRDALVAKQNKQGDVITNSTTVFDADLIKPWKNGIVYYSFQPDVSLTNDENVANLNRFLNACREWETVANIRFVQWDSAQPSHGLVYIRVQNSNRNGTRLGMQENAPDKVAPFEIRDWDSPFVILHELGHTLGLVHEHTRQDRDQYVTINKQNIKPRQPSPGQSPSDPELTNQGQFAIIPDTYVSKDEDQKRTHYDYQSVMHYPTNAFAYPGTKTIEVTAPHSSALNNIIGQRSYLSEGDKAGIVAIYGLPYSAVDCASDPSGRTLVMMNYGFPFDQRWNFFTAIQSIRTAPVNNSLLGDRFGIDTYENTTDRWFPTAVTSGGDFTNCALLTSTESVLTSTNSTIGGRAQLRFFRDMDTGNPYTLGQPLYLGPHPDWRSSDIASTSFNTTYILWTRTDGRMSIDIIGANRVPQGNLIQAVGNDWYAKAIAAGPNNSVFVLFNHPLGASIIWRVEADGGLSRVSGTPFYHPSNSRFFGKDIVVRNNGEPQILMTHQDGSAYTATFSATNFDTVIHSEHRLPFHSNGVLQRPTALGNGMNNQTRLLYNAQRYGAATAQIYVTPNSTPNSNYALWAEFGF